MTTRITFNKGNLDALPFAVGGKQITYYDTNKTNLALRVGATSKTFIVYTRPKGSTSPVRISLGKYGEVTIKHASDLAAKELAKIADGHNPVADKKQAKLDEQQAKTQDEQTFSWMMGKYKQEHIIDYKGGSASTLKDIRITLDYFDERTVTTLKKSEDGKTWIDDMEVKLSSWHELPFRSITRQMVIDRFEILEKTKPQRKQKTLQPICRTNQMSFKFASSAYNYIIARDELDVKEQLRNPFDIMSSRKKWKATNVRTRFVDFNRTEFKKWWKAVEDYDYCAHLVSDYILFSLLQAGRSIDAANLLWKYVDLELNQINYPKTKNGEEYIFPMSKRVREIIDRRKSLNNDDMTYVFDYKESKTSHIPQDVRYHFEMIYKVAGKLISHHDLRRTWASAAYSLDMDKRMIDYCLKHKIGDVNKHYFMRNEAKILRALQTIENFFEGKVVQSLKEATKDDNHQIEQEEDFDLDSLLAEPSDEENDQAGEQSTTDQETVQ